jgi:hypothetical protein
MLTLNPRCNEEGKGPEPHLRTPQPPRRKCKTGRSRMHIGVLAGGLRAAAPLLRGHYLGQKQRAAP